MELQKVELYKTRKQPSLYPSLLHGSLNIGEMLVSWNASTSEGVHSHPPTLLSRMGPASSSSDEAVQEEYPINLT